MGLYAGMDLHSKNTYLGIPESELNERVYGKRLVNDLGVILNALEPFCESLQGIAVESAYNWYWLVDGLMDADYRCVHLAKSLGYQAVRRFKIC